jgi:hypothetical protein
MYAESTNVAKIFRKYSGFVLQLTPAAMVRTFPLSNFSNVPDISETQARWRKIPVVLFLSLLVQNPPIGSRPEAKEKTIV